MWIFFVAFTALIFSINVHAADFKNSGLPVSKATSAIELHTDSNYSKWVLVLSGIQYNKNLNPAKDKWFTIGEYNQYYISTEKKLLITARISSESRSKILDSYSQKTSKIYSLFINKAFAESFIEAGLCESCGTLTNPVAQVSSQITAQSILQSCEWNPAELLLKTVEAAKGEIQGLLDGSLLQKIDHLITNFRSLATEFVEKVIPGISKIAEVLPIVAEQWICTKMRDKLPFFAAAMIFPQTASLKIPLLVADVIKDAKILMNNKLISTIMNVANSGKTPSNKLHTLSKLSLEQPKNWDDIKIDFKNFQTHVDKHTHFFKGQGPDPVLNYASQIDRFAKKSTSNDVFLYVNSNQIKLSLKSGEMLVTSDKGDFITFYIIRGQTPEERLRNFIIKEKNSTLSKPDISP